MHRRIQLVTVGDLLADQRLDMPAEFLPYVKAQTAKMDNSASTLLPSGHLALPLLNGRSDLRSQPNVVKIAEALQVDPSQLVRELRTEPQRQSVASVKETPSRRVPLTRRARVPDGQHRQQESMLLVSDE
jgi:hypothetical protein